MSPLRQFAIRNELLYSGFVLPNVQIFFGQKISFATFGVSIDDFFTRYAGLGYSLFGYKNILSILTYNVTVALSGLIPITGKLHLKWNTVFRF